MSSDIAIRVEGLGKQYRIGSSNGNAKFKYRSFGDTFVQTVRRPWGMWSDRNILNDNNSFWALEDVSFEVKRGECVGIIGRNGAGKSTLLKILSRITKPTLGQIQLHGRVGSLLEVGTGFHPELSGRENIFLNGAILGMTRGEIRSKLDEIVDFSEIEKFLDTPVKQYSSGMYTRLAFSVAAHLDPEILVVDEVLAVGDAEFQRKCLGKMQDVVSGGRTILFVSHNMGAIRELCARGVLLDAGRTSAIGSADEVLVQYIKASNLSTETLADQVGNQSRPGARRIHRCGVCQSGNESDDEFDARFGFSVYAELEQPQVAPFTFGVRISNSFGVELLHITNQDDVNSLSVEGLRGRVVVEIPPIPLRDGDYYISYFLCDRSFGIEHALYDAVSFTVRNDRQRRRYADSPLVVDAVWSSE